MTLKCPACGETHDRHLVERSEYSPVAPVVAGGVVLAFVYSLSRKRRFRCEQCHELFFAHTIGSRVWLTIWILFWVALAIGIIGMVIDASTR